MSKEMIIDRYTKFVLRLGALSKPIHEQIKEQGLKARKKDFELEEKLSSAATLLRIHGLLPPAQARRAEEKLFARILKKIREINKLGA